MRLSRNMRRFSQPLSITTCADKLLQNDPGFVELSLERVGDDFDLARFVHALRSNSTVKHVCFSGTFVRNLQPDQWTTMLESIGYLQKLEELQIWCSTVPVAVFARTLRHATKLQKVYLFRVGLSASNATDVLDLASALRNHASLQDVRIGGFHLLLNQQQQQQNDDNNNNQEDDNNDNNDNDDDDIRLDAVVEAFAVMPKLEVVSLQLSGAQAVVPFSGRALGTLFTSRSVTDLYLSRLGLTAEHFRAIASGLASSDPAASTTTSSTTTISNDDGEETATTTRTEEERALTEGDAAAAAAAAAAATTTATSSSSSLRVLDLFGNNVCNEHIVWIADALARNTHLETLVLPCPAADLSLESCAAISRALRVNTTLVTLNLPRSNLNDSGLGELAAGLTVNTTLKKIEVGVAKDISQTGMDALTDMLERNYELERVVVSSATQTVKDKVDHYMRLNEVGRGTLLRSDGRQATREQWVEMLISVRTDLDCLFYFTKMNPSIICQFVNITEQQVIITQEFVQKKFRRHTMDHFSEKQRQSWLRRRRNQQQQQNQDGCNNGNNNDRAIDNNNSNTDVKGKDNYSHGRVKTTTIVTKNGVVEQRRASAL